MAALGSSFAAGPGVAPVEDRRAMRSARNYPHLVAQALGADLVDATVSGATTGSVVSSSRRRGGRSDPPQVSAVPPDADLVTVTAGGNDLGYLGSVVGTALAHRLSRRAATRPLGRLLRARVPPAPGDEDAAAAASGLVRVVEEVSRRAPGARVLLVDYLTVVGPGPGRPGSPFTPEERERFRTTAHLLAGAFAAAAEQTGAELVRASRASAHHGFDDDEPWVRGLRAPLSPRRLGSSFHPNEAGMEAVARAVLDHLGRPAPDLPR